MFLLWLGILLLYNSGSVRGHAVSGQLYSSLTHMKDVFLFDSKILDILPYLPSYVVEVGKYKESYNCLALDTGRLGNGDFLDIGITGNPLHIYLVIKRLVLYWPAIDRAMQVIISNGTNCVDKYETCEWWSNWSECEKNPSFMLINCQLSCGLCGRPDVQDKLTLLQKLQFETVLPSENDLRGAALALARLQQVYRLQIPHMANGWILNVSTCVKLSTYDCIRIANESHFEGEYANSWQWYNYAMASTTEPDLKGHIRGLMTYVKQQHDQYYRANVPQFFPKHLSEIDLQAPWDTTYSQLCRGRNFMTAEESAQLKCHVSSRGSPYLRIQPVKYEQLHYDPEMYLFYDVVSPFERQSIKDTSKEYLHRSVVMSSPDPVEIRVSQTAWLNNRSHPVLPKIAQRISAITRLHVFEGPFEDMAGEDLQVLSYGIGGHYNYHHDPFYKCSPKEQWHEIGSKLDSYSSGDRMATWMFYLSSVEAGGRTAFPQAGLSLQPVEGAAVFWYNIKKNGDGNDRSEHGGCPVLLGHKWVANKWIRENRNFLRRPCGLREGE